MTSVTLQCVPAFNLHAHETIEPLDEVLADIDAFARSADHAEFYWMPGSARCQVKRNQRTDEPARPQSRLAYVRDKYLAENVGVGCGVPRRPLDPTAGALDRQGRGGGDVRARVDRSQRPRLHQSASRAIRRDGVRRAARTSRRGGRPRRAI